MSAVVQGELPAVAQPPQRNRPLKETDKKFEKFFSHTSNDESSRVRGQGVLSIE